MRVALLLTLLSMNAQASFLQEYCSNAQGTVKASVGHVESKLTITQRDYHGGEIQNNTIELHYSEVNFKYSKEREISSTSTTSCQPGDVSGFGSWTKVTVKEITISNRDGSEFSENTLNLSKDRKTVSAILICKRETNSRIGCQN